MPINYNYIDNMTSYIPQNTTNKFKDVQGRWRIRSLFYEDRLEGYEPLYTLNSEDREVNGVTYQSLRRIYLEEEHIVGCEYDFANKYLGGWKHWELICKSSYYKSVILEWKEELEIKQKAQHIRKMIMQSYSEGTASFNATKYLLDKGYIEKDGKGRPKKEDVEKQAKIMAKAEAELADDLARLNNVVNLRQ